MSLETAKKNQFLLTLLHLGFFASGIATVLIGQVLPILSTKLGLNDGQSSYFFTWQFAGSLLGTFLTNWFGRRGKFVLATIIGCFLMAIGIGFLNFDSYQVCLFGFFINGIGIGLTLPSINMLIVEMNPIRTGAALSILNFFWGVGAILSQPFIDLLSNKSSIFIPTVLLSIVFLFIGAAMFFQPPEDKYEQSGETESGEIVPIWTSPIAWMIAVFNFVHVGFESAMGGWLKTYTLRLEGVSVWFPPIFIYFLFFVIGRGIAPLFFRFINENKFLFISLLTILIGMCILLFGEGVFLLSLGSAIAGLGTSSVFPTNLSRFSQIFGASATRRATPLFICGTLGATFTTWIIGFISNRYENNLRSGMFVLLGSVIFLIILQSFLNIKSKKINEN